MSTPQSRRDELETARRTAVMARDEIRNAQKLIRQALAVAKELAAMGNHFIGQQDLADIIHHAAAAQRELRGLQRILELSQGSIVAGLDEIILSEQDGRR